MQVIATTVKIKPLTTNDKYTRHQTYACNDQ